MLSRCTVTLYPWLKQDRTFRRDAMIGDETDIVLPLTHKVVVSAAAEPTILLMAVAAGRMSIPPARLPPVT